MAAVKNFGLTSWLQPPPSKKSQKRSRSRDFPTWPLQTNLFFIILISYLNFVVGLGLVLSIVSFPGILHLLYYRRFGARKLGSKKFTEPVSEKFGAEKSLGTWNQSQDFWILAHSAKHWQVFTLSNGLEVMAKMLPSTHVSSQMLQKSLYSSHFLHTLFLVFVPIIRLNG